MELISGPDVGGGFLFQLTSEVLGELVTYTTHVQEGGLDGGEPTAGSPESIGFALPGRMCPIGGRQCWHRDIDVPAADSLRVRFAYNRLRFVIGPMIRQHDPSVPVPFDSGVREVLRRVIPALSSAGEPWLVGGSAAPALLGAAVRPRDLDLSTSRRGVELIGETLAEYLIQAPGRSGGRSPSPRWGGAAFVGTFKDGLRVEWAESSISPSPVPGPEYEWSTSALARAVSASVDEWSVPVAPPEIALVKSLSRGRTDRTGPILELVRRRGADWELFDQLVDGYTSDARLRAAWRSAVHR